MNLATPSSEEILELLSLRFPGFLYLYQLFPDGKSRLPFASKNIEAIYEVSLEEIALDADIVLRRLHPDDRDWVIQSVLESRDRLEKWECEYRVILPQRGLRWLSGLAEPVPQEDGSVIWHGVITDITNRKEAEEKQQRQAVFSDLVAAINRRWAGANSDSLGELVNATLKDLGTHLEVGRVYLFQFDAAREMMSATQEWTAPGVASFIKADQNVRIADFPWWSQELEKAGHVHIADVDLLPPEARAEQSRDSLSAFSHLAGCRRRSHGVSGF
jgi:hypothetical protein